MCGIAGIFRRRGVDPDDRTRLAHMTERLRHRGPDGSGLLAIDSRSGWFSVAAATPEDPVADVLLGHRRLAILDPSAAGGQPMSNEDGTVFVTFNGAIYNHLELRRDLEGRGHRFASRTDTEVIVHAYEEWGDECTRRMNGMWAFALWDQRQRRLVCSRDRFGVKPLYFVANDDRFFFGSEIKALLPALEAAPTADLETIDAFLAEGRACDTPATFFAGVERFPAGETWALSSSSHRRARYWDYGESADLHDLRDPVGSFRALFADAVEIRLQSDRPVGVALSGGLDSTAIAAFAAAQRPIQAFTAAFDGSDDDEFRYADLAAKRLGIALHTARYDALSLVDDLRDVVWHMDSPALRSQVLPRWHLAAVAARHVTVVLEGQGSDELLAGYPLAHFPQLAIAELLRRGPFAALGLSRAARDIVRSEGFGPIRRWARSRRWRRKSLHRELRARCRDRDTAGEPLPLPSRLRHRDRLTRYLHAQHSRTLLPHLLSYGDAVGMGRSLETRFPFLDHRLVDFVFALEPRWKLDGAETKVLLRRACGDRMPAEVLARRRKIGFAPPIASWLRGHLEAAIRPLLLSRKARERALLDAVAVGRVLDRLAGGDDDVAELVFRWLSLEVWFGLYVDGAS